MPLTVETKKPSSTTFVLGLATLMSLVVAIEGTFGGYYFGYEQGRLELGAADAAQKTAKAAPTTPPAAAPDKPAGPTPLKPTSYAASDFPELASLSGDQQEVALQVLNTTLGACEPCVAAGKSLGACIKDQPDKPAFGAPPICENMLRLLGRVVREARAGKPLADVQADVTYDEPWVKVDLTAAPVRGSADAPITLVEYSDFQCPYCGKVQPTIKSLEEKYGDKIKVVFLNSPLSFHERAEPAARAALAANRQGKFWGFHDQLFERQKEIGSPTLFDEIAKGLGLNMEQFKADQSVSYVTDQLNHDKKLAGKVGVRGTPTFFVNGYRVRGAKPLPYFEKLIDREISDL